MCCNLIKKSSHSVEITEFYCHHFFAKIPWNQLFAKELYSKLIWRKKFAWQWISRFSTLCFIWQFYDLEKIVFFQWERISRFSTLWTSVEKRDIHCHAKFFSSNQLRVKFFSKKLISRNFCEKMVAVKFRNFHTVHTMHIVQQKEGSV